VQTSRGQRVVVAALMAGVFVVSMGLAYLTTGSTSAARGVRGATLQRVNVHGLSLDAPGAWRRDQVAERELGGKSVMALRDPDRPERLMVISAVDAGEATAPDEVVDWGMRRFLSRAQMPTAQMEQLSGMPAASRRLTVTAYGGQSASRGGTRGRGIALHLMATLSTDAQRYWLVYLTDRIDPARDGGRRREQDLRLLRRIVGTATLNPSEGTP